MFMSAPATTTAPPPHSDPRQDRRQPPATPRVDSLLGLLRLLITFGRTLSVALQPPPTADGTPAADIGLAQRLLRLARGLMRAAALETLLRRRAEQGRDLVRVRVRKPRHHRTRPPEPKRANHLRDLTRDVDPPVLRLPTAQEIANELRRRPIGAILADICADIGISRDDLDRAQWDRLRRMIDDHGGSFSNYHRRMVHRWARAFGVALMQPPAALPAPPPPPIRPAPPRLLLSPTRPLLLLVPTLPPRAPLPPFPPAPPRTPPPPFLPRMPLPGCATGPS